MSQLRRHADDEPRREAAAAWVVRLQGADVDEADAMAFDAWLSASAANAQAYDEALAVSQEYARNADALTEALSRRRAVSPSRRQAWFAMGPPRRPPPRAC
ncbi:DUF4880 domain-containing protein [Phenylobacterium sp. J426]|uniref:FecR/PupR family sigma factor regulator n=1 Tax=Phenylobacterium sp. J426 TaxID=2898439 RepID=UPI0021510FCE|nr:DUF4880 domain-containing protein [Phenylobacterium sp. J426]MCR5876303.1 DUF4880 domain-containing protein [Phenylobacterium sp. J426]